ncbi:acylphosphatase [Nesterenkonia sphaerica]|uniref:Acylphosphatase n=1 Tax=Nesterenkonia sphaerica TaxID=1804988 RepID=A0A5R9A3Z5_9MICC|nr:acylphosphatase [Nesterenkonia sphaerica]TLP73260.1 acylphosphatase [Nesterenkonia sphaerica]
MESHFSAGTSVRVTGTVQGVNFRNSAKRQAEELGLVGWVRNTPDGAVELLIGGDGPAVEALISWCGTGPKRAEVTSVETREASAAELQALPAEGFRVRRG